MSKFLPIVLLSLSIYSSPSPIWAQGEGWITERDRASWKATSPNSVNGTSIAVIVYQCVTGDGIVFIYLSHPVEIEGATMDLQRRGRVANVKLRWGGRLLSDHRVIQSETISSTDDWRRYIVVGT